MFCAAQLRIAECEDSACNAAFEHVGGERSPVWAPEIEFHGNNRYSVLSYGRTVQSFVKQPL